jgi:hypothetical protein
MTALLLLLLAAPIPSYVVRRAASPVQVDGKLNDAVWAAASPITLVMNADGAPSPLKTEARMLYDDQYLYVAFRAADPEIWATMKKRDQHLWEEEVVEVFVQPNPAHTSYIEIEVNPLGTVLDIFLLDVGKPLLYESWNSARLKTGVHVEGKEWTAEIALPFEDCVTAPHLPPRSGDRWRLNLYRTDRKPRHLDMAWSPTLGERFHVPARFGEIVFQ